MIKKITYTSMIAVIVIAVNGCSVNNEPRMRLGSYPTSTPGTNFMGVNNLGNHSYYFPSFENNGIVYTCRGGHIDIAHLRIAADHVKYLYGKTKRHLLKNDIEFTFKLNVERSRYFVQLKYPDNWGEISKEGKEEIANEIALELGQYFAYSMTMWHEVLTWFGFKTMVVFSEFPSSFSWEDSYSNLLGTIVGAEALQDRQHNFNEAMTIALKKELKELQIQLPQTARAASEKMRGKWFNGNLFMDLRIRNTNLGLDDGYVTPILVPGICEDAEPQLYPVPRYDTLSKYGFSMKFEIEPREMEKGKILKIVYPNNDGKRIQPSIHYPLIIDYIKEDVIKKGFKPI